MNVDALVTTARPVTTERVESRLPQECARCDTASLLTPSERQLFQNRPLVTCPSLVWPHELPGRCYMVTKQEERNLHQLLLQRKCAVLLREEEVPKLADGSLLLGGMFLVEDRPNKFRLITDL